jgi:hypothetical protein
MKKAGARRASAALRPRGASASRTPAKAGAVRSNRSSLAAPASRGRSATPLESFPHLRAFLSGYLHQDFLLDHRTPGDALRAFLAEASAAERRALRDDVRAFLAATGGAPWREALEAFLGLGGAWLPPSRRALVGLLAGVD